LLRKQGRPTELRPRYGGVGDIEKRPPAPSVRGSDVIAKSAHEDPVTRHGGRTRRLDIKAAANTQRRLGGGHWRGIGLTVLPPDNPLDSLDELPLPSIR
jgi:hypothetical protein